MLKQPEAAAPRLLPTDGGFAQRLDAALDARGLGLGRVCERLRVAGVSSSPATLSHWRHGRTRPRRKDALRVVVALERILEVPTGYLVEPLSRMIDASQFQAAPTRILAELQQERFAWGLPAPDATRRILSHEVVTIDESRRYAGSRIRQVVRCGRRSIDRIGLVVWVTPSEGEPEDPALLPSRSVVPSIGARLGRTRLWPEHGLRLVELLLEIPLEPDRLGTLEWEILPDEAEARDDGDYITHALNASTPTATMIMEVRFAALPRPELLTLRTSRHLDPEHEPGTALRVSPSGTAVGALRDIDGGGIRMAWEWPT